MAFGLLQLLTNCTYIGSRRRRSSSDGAKAKKGLSTLLYSTTSFLGVRLSLIYDAIEAGRNAFGTEKRDVIWALSLYVTTKHVMSLF